MAQEPKTQSNKADRTNTSTPTDAEVQAAKERQEEQAGIPDSALTNGQKDGRGQGTVGEPETTSFNERTAVRQPFILEDGTQDNGARDLELQDGARGEATRLGNNTVREDTRQAIKDGKIPASDQPEGTLPGEEREEDKVKNPVK